MAVVRVEKPVEKAKEVEGNHYGKFPGRINTNRAQPGNSGTRSAEQVARMGSQEANWFINIQRVGLRSPCRWCGGNHYDSMCSRRGLYNRASRVFWAGHVEGVAIFHVDTTYDAEYDREHRDFVNAVFVNGWSFQDYEKLTEHFRDDEEYIDCGHLAAEDAVNKEIQVPADELEEDDFKRTIIHVPTPKQVCEL
jgi:hypothetical protein